MFKKIIFTVLILFSAGYANAFQAGVSVDYVQSVDEGSIYIPPVNVSNMPRFKYADIGYLVRFKPVNMLSATEIRLAETKNRKIAQINQTFYAPSVYNISFENGGRLNSDDTANNISIEELIAKNPGKQEYIYAYAVKLKSESRYKEAIMQIDKALSINNNYALGYFLKGDILRIMGNYKEASRQYSKTLEINPYCTDAYFNIAKMLEIYGQKELALNYYEMAYATNPNDLEIRNRILKLSKTGA